MGPAAGLAANGPGAASTLMAASNAIAQAKHRREPLAGGGQLAAFGFELSGAIARRASAGKRVAVSVSAAIHREIVASAAQARWSASSKRGRGEGVGIVVVINNHR